MTLPTTATVLVIEDNALLAAGVRSNLEFEGHRVLVAQTGEAGLALASTESPDCIVLDLMLPGMDGLTVLRTLRARGVEAPVLILTARCDEADKVRGLRDGADDYVTKPFGLLEFLARVEALLRRRRSAPPAVVEQLGDVTVDLTLRTVQRAGVEVPLRPKEFDLLAALLRRVGQVVTRDVLLREVWGYDESVVSRTVDTHMAELRRKLEADPAEPRHLLTVRKTGYRLAR
jgi:DNA-binding response OmpR family regulator